MRKVIKEGDLLLAEVITKSINLDTLHQPGQVIQRTYTHTKVRKAITWPYGTSPTQANQTPKASSPLIIINRCHLIEQW